MKRFFIFFNTLIDLLFLCSCNANNQIKTTSLKPIYAMDTIIYINFYNVDNADSYFDDIKNIYDSYDSLSSDYELKNVSNVKELNDKRRIEASDDLILLLQSAISYMNITNGYYNPFIGRLSHLWKDAIKDKRIVDDSIISSELEIMNSTSIVFDGNVVSLVGDGNIDLGGIAKGFATKKVCEYLKSKNIESYLINAGESSIALGTKDSNNFKVALSAPYSNSNISVISTKNKSIGTSSGRNQNCIIDGIRYHHLLNPFTGWPADFYDNVNILNDDPLLCDVYSTAVFAMDMDMAISFANELNFDILLYKDNEIIYESQGFTDAKV